MNSTGWKCLSACVVACGLWIQATAENVPLERPSNMDKKDVDNMQYFGRLGKRGYEDVDDKRVDPSMFGRLGKREEMSLDDNSLYADTLEDSQQKRLDSMAYFGRLGKRYDNLRFFGKLGKRNLDREQLSKLLDETSKRMDSKYFGRLGKRFDAKQFYGRLG